MVCYLVSYILLENDVFFFHILLVTGNGKKIGTRISADKIYYGYEADNLMDIMDTNAGLILSTSTDIHTCVRRYPYMLH
jgi:hypothetical protein